MPQQLKEHLISYLESVRATPSLPSEAIKELDDGIRLLKKPKHITFPYASDSSLDTVSTLHKIMNNFFKKYPVMLTQDQIDLQELNFQRFIQNTGLMKTNIKPSRRG
jgi:hypothetical protein